MNPFKLTQDVAIDLGTANTIIIINGQIRYNAPSIVAAPTFFKMMMEDGPYDYLKHAKMAEAKALAIKLESQTNDDINTELSISQARNQRRLEAEMKANEDVMDKIADTQSELIKTSIALWRKEELKKIKDNPTI